MNRTHESKNLADALKEGERSLKFNISTRKFQELQEQLKKKKKKKTLPKETEPDPRRPLSPFKTFEFVSIFQRPSRWANERDFLLEGSSRAGSGGGGRSKESGIVGAKAKRRERDREREGRVNNLHSDESIVLRQAHATVPIMALQPVDAPTTSLSLSFSLNPL